MSATRSSHLCSCVAIISVLQATYAGPVFQGLGDFPGGLYDSRAWGVSADGTAVVGRGWSSDPLWPDGPLGIQAFRWTSATGMVGLGSLPLLPDSQGLATSGDGATVVGWSRLGNGAAHPFRWTPASGMEALPGLSGGDGSGLARGVSSDGSVIVGESRLGGYYSKAVRWINGGAPVLLEPFTNEFESSVASDVSADGSVIVGGFYHDSHSQVFRWAQDGGASLLSPLPGDSEVRDSIVSGDGMTIVGQSVRHGAIVSDAFVWQEDSGTLRLAERPNGIGQIEAMDISFDGSTIVGIMIENDPSFIVHPFIWTRADGLRDLEEVLVGDFGLVDVVDWHLAYATGISSDGRVIVGWGTNPSGEAEAWIATIPEPSALLLLSVGAFFALRRNRSTQRSSSDVGTTIDRPFGRACMPRS